MSLPRPLRRHWIQFYKQLLKLYPQQFRQQFGWEMLQVFMDLLDEAWQKDGRAGLRILWLHTIEDSLVNAFRQHLEKKQKD